MKDKKRTVSFSLTGKTTDFLSESSRAIFGHENRSMMVEMMVNKLISEKSVYEVKYIDSDGDLVSESVTELDKFVLENDGVEFSCKKVGEVWRA